MSFTWFADKPLRTREQVAAEVHQVSLSRGLEQFATILTCMAIEIEVGAKDEWWCPSNPTAEPSSTGFPCDSNSNDGRSVGYLQQQTPWWNTVADEMNLSHAADEFQKRLADNYMDALNDPHQAGVFVQNVQGSEFPDRYQTAWDIAHDVVGRALAVAPPPVVIVAPPVTPTNDHPLRPGFSEFQWWSPNCESRDGTTIDLWLWHTEQGHYNDQDAARDLSPFLNDPKSQVSYHYCGSQNTIDQGVTVFDIVDTDMASWSVLSANKRSIDFVVAGSDAGWSREQWMAHSNVLDVGCYICAQDCIKYNIDPRILSPDPNDNNVYHLAPPGISDHKYVTKYLKDGTHTDCGPNFPWDYIEMRTAYWIGVLHGTIATTGTVTPPPLPVVPTVVSDADKLDYIYQQVGPGNPAWVHTGNTMRDELYAIAEKVGVPK